MCGSDTSRAVLQNGTIAHGFSALDLGPITSVGVQAKRGKCHVVLTTYELLLRDSLKLSNKQWHYLILDEGHRIKNHDCKLNLTLKSYRIKHKLLLTGTPVQNKLEELWSLLNFLVRRVHCPTGGKTCGTQNW